MERSEMFSLMKRAPRRRSNEVESTEAYYEIAGDEVQEDNRSKKREGGEKKRVPDQKGAEL